MLCSQFIVQMVSARLESGCSVKKSLFSFLLMPLLSLPPRSRDSLLVECRTRDRKVASSNPHRSGGRIFFSRVNSLRWLLFDVRPIPVFTQWHVKNPGQSAKSAGGGLHVNTHTPWPKEIGVFLLCRSPGIVREPIRKRAHTQLVREHTATVVSVRSATVYWSWPKEWN